MIPDYRSAIGALLDGRFAVLEEIKQGQGISTFFGREESTGQAVVIKVAETSALAYDRLRRLEREAIILQQLRSAALSRLLFFRIGPLVTCLVLYHVPGITLQRKLALHGALDPRDLVRIARAALKALQEIHEQGILHRDVKPSNLIIGEGSDGEPVTLIDFGLARSDALDAASPRIPVGTVRYMAPEQSGAIDRPLGPHSDLYSLGAVLFECLTGRPLFPGEELGEILRGQLGQDAPSFRDLKVGVPRSLGLWLRGLLRGDPDGRYRTAGAALQDLALIEEGLTRGDADSVTLLGPDASDRPASSLLDPEFVGREEELQRLAGEWEKTARGEGGLVLVEAESGGGKTRLLREFSRSLPWAPWGQAVSQAAQGPFRIFGGVISSVLQRARRDEKFAARLRSRLAERSDALCDALPECAELFGRRAAHPLGPETLGEVRSIEALSALLNALGAEGDPALIILDDCQWADDLSLRLLPFWRERPEQGRYVMLAVAFRSEETGPGHRLRKLSERGSIILPPFDARDCRRLLESMAGRIPDPAVVAVSRLSQGNPFMASAILHGLVEAGALYRTAGGWSVDPGALAEAQASRKAGIFLARRLKEFPAPVRELLSVGAIIGKEFELGEVAALANVPATEAADVLREACRRKVAWLDLDGARYSFAHDKIRETLLELIEPPRRKALHLAVARRLEASPGAQPFELAYHFSEAGHPREALPHALKAADLSRARHALHVAEIHFRIAESALDFATDSERIRILEGLGDVRMLLGGYAEAGRYLEEARRGADAPAARARIQGKIGELAFKEGKVADASLALEEALRTLGVRVPRRTGVCLLFLAREVVIQALHTLFPRLFLARRRPDRAAPDLLQAGLLSRLAYIYWFGKGKFPCAWAHLKELNLLERYPETLELAQAYSEHAPVMTMVPWFSRGLHYVERSLAIRRRFGDPWGEGQSQHFYGVVLYAASRFEESIDRCRAAARLLERTGDRWEVNTANWHIGFALYRLGRLGESIEILRKTHEAGSRIGDHQAAGISLSGWSKAASGRIPSGLLEAELNRAVGDRHTRIELLQAEAVRCLAEGVPSRAVTLLREARKIMEESGFKQEYVVPVLPWLATALRKTLESLPPSLPAERKRLLREFSATARRAISISLQYKNNLPHALRESAFLAAFQGKGARARQLFSRSIEEARRLSERQEEGLSLAAAGETGIQLGWKGAREELDRGRAILAQIEAAVTGALEPRTSTVSVSPSLADRFSSLLLTGRGIASALSADAVFRSVRETALLTLRGDECLVLENPASRESFPDQVSRELVLESVRQRRPVLFTGRERWSATESMVLSDARSAISAPIIRGAEVVACFYVIDRRIGMLYGEDERRIAEFIGTLAGAALENAAGFARVQSLSEERLRLHQEGQKAIQARDEFLSVASHELRTPLTSLKLHVDLLARGCEGRSPQAASSDRFRQSLRTINRQIGRLTRLVDDMLDVSRLSVGRFQLQKELLDVRELVGEVLDRFRPELDAAGCELRVGKLEPCFARIDPVRIEQTLANLLTNAIKYAKGAPVEATLEPDPTSRRLRITIRDHGPGIPPEHQPRVFDRFERGSPSSEINGLGLGLYIASQIMKEHDGNIELESRPGQGCAFHLYLPLSESAVSEPGIRRLPASVPAPVARPRKSAHP